MNKGKSNERFVTPEEVSAAILKKIKAIAEVRCFYVLRVIMTLIFRHILEVK